MKNVFNQKGSTLLMVLIMTAVLTIFGTALISMTFMNINMKYNNDRVKKATYYSESGIDQVYAYVGSTIEDTLELAREDTDEFKEDLLYHLEQSIEPIEVIADDGTITLETPSDAAEVHEGELFLSSHLMGMNDTEFLIELGLKKSATYTKLYIENDNGFEDKLLNMEALTEVLDNYYKLKFMYLYNTKYNGTDRIDDYIEDELEDIYYNGEKCIITVTNGIDPFALPNDTTFTIKGVHSEFNYNDRVTRAVTTNIVVKAPEKLYPFITVEDVLLVENNPIWQNALVANDDIIFKGNALGKEVEIHGDIYAYGTKEIDGLAIDGITLENGAKVDVLGDLVTKKNIQTTGEDDLLNVRHGLLYCDSLITQAGADNSTISIDNGNVYTRDDIEINAEKSDVSISNGSYYGFSDGTESNSSHDNSSAIIINVPLENVEDDGTMIDGATLKIDGITPNLDPSGSQIYKTKNIFSDPGVWVFGTSYANFDGEPAGDGTTQLWPYQTGESVSIIGNYIAYTLPISTPTIVENSKYQENYVVSRKASVDSYDEESAIEINVGTKYDEDNPLNEEVSFFNANDKKNYFWEIYNQFPGLLDFGTTSSLNIKNYQYVIGAKITDAGNLNIDSSTGFTEYPILRKEIRHDYIKYLLNTSNYVKQENESEKPDYPLFEDISDPLYIPEYPEDNYDVLAAHLDYYDTGVLDAEDGSGDNRVVDFVHQSDLGNEKATEIVYVEHLSSPSASEIKNYRLVGIGAGGTESGFTDIRSETGADLGYFQGIIITQGDVIIDGDVNFTGSIIAGGTIIFRNGSGKSIIHNSEPKTVEYMAELIRNIPDLRTILKKGAQGTPIQFIRQDVIQETDGSGTDISNVKNVYKQLIDFEFWRLD